jgi:hypothetical protein
MADVLFLAILTAFFGLCVLFVKACDRMVQSGAASKDSGSDLTGEPEPERLAA